MRIRFLFSIAVLLINVVATDVVFGQSVPKQASLAVSGEVKTPLSISLADMQKLPLTTVKSKDRNQKEHTYEGVTLGVILKNAGVSLGEELRGENLMKYLLIEAMDGYQVLFSLAEVDPSFTNRNVILAYKKDGALLSADEGPFHIIIENEKRMSRNARQVSSIKVLFAK